MMSLLSSGSGNLRISVGRRWLPIPCSNSSALVAYSALNSLLVFWVDIDLRFDRLLTFVCGMLTTNKIFKF